MDEVAHLLLDLVSVPSPTGDTGAITETVMRRARELGLEPRIDGAGNVRMSAGGGGPRILLLCHLDTVPGDIPVKVDRGAIHGRGSVDAKGCLAAAMSAVSRLAERSGRGTLEVVAVPDEEGPSLGARHLVTGPSPDAVIVGEPSGWEGLTIGYKGAVRLVFHRSTPKAHSGAGGRNSAEETVAVWNALESRLAVDAAQGRGAGAFDVPTATLETINTTDDGITQTTEMRVDVRLPPGYDIDGLLSFLDGVRGEVGMELTGAEPAVLALKNTALVRAMLAAIRAEGGDPVFKRKTGTSDMNVAAAAWPGVPIIAYGPGDSRLDHTPEERLDLAELSRAAKVLEAALERLLVEAGDRSKL